jgi:hypothetical protein
LNFKERPAHILQRRLEQAGYDEADGMDILGQEDLSFLVKFVFKSTLLGASVCELISCFGIPTDTRHRMKNTI